MISDYEVNELNAQTRQKLQEETQRKKWCIEQSVNLDESNSDNVLKTAEKIYLYVYGERE